MTRKLWVIGAVVVGLVLASSAAYAVDRQLIKPNMPNLRLGQIYDRSNILRFDEGPVNMPRPVSTPGLASGLSASQTVNPVPGPVAMSFDSPSLSGPMAQPRAGGSIYTGQQLADREIKTLIRRLN